MLSLLQLQEEKKTLSKLVFSILIIIVLIAHAMSVASIVFIRQFGKQGTFPCKRVPFDALMGS
jgi:hypothetical protein